MKMCEMYVYFGKIRNQFGMQKMFRVYYECIWFGEVAEIH